jgi:hypothetical protein
MSDPWVDAQLAELGLAPPSTPGDVQRLFNKNEPRNPHSGEWIRKLGAAFDAGKTTELAAFPEKWVGAADAHHLHGQQVHGRTRKGRPITGLFHHGDQTVQPRHSAAQPVTHVRPLPSQEGKDWRAKNRLPTGPGPLKGGTATDYTSRALTDDDDMLRLRLDLRRFS